jgi:hypothetical protein
MNTTLGVLVTTNNNEYNQLLLQINKAMNTVRIDAHVYDQQTKNLLFQTTTTLHGFVGVTNCSGLTLANNKENVVTTLINSLNDVSFMENYKTPYNTTDVVLSNDFRTSITNYEVVFHKPGDVITDNSSQNQVKLPFGTNLTNIRTDLTNLENRLTSLENGSGSKDLITFNQSVIDHTSINTPFNTLKETITTSEKYSTTMKTLVDNNVFPKTTNTMLTIYYTSYIKTNIPEVTNNTRKILFRYYCTNTTYSAITISIINSPYNPTELPPQLHIAIYNSDSTNYKQYVVTADTPKQLSDLTSDLAEARPGEKIVSAKFTPNEFGKSSEIFYKDCVNILSNVFISYTYDE